MTEVSIEPTNVMSAEEQELADAFYDALMDHSRGSDRSAQASAFKVGVSDLGFCAEQTRRMLLGLTPEPTDMLLAWIGTAMGREAEAAYVKAHPHVLDQLEVTLTLHGEERVYNIPGHLDLLDPVAGILIDVKTDYGLSTIRRTGPSRQQRFQRMGYAKAAWAAGYFPNHELDDLRVANVWIDRAGIDREVHVHMEPYDEAVIFEAAEWLDEVVYAYLQTAAGNPTEAEKEPPREMCYAVCGFAAECRGYDTDVSGLLTDETVLTALDMYVEGLKIEKFGRREKEQAKEHLRNISGYTRSHILRWVWINEVQNEDGSIRRGYYKIDVKDRYPKKAVRKSAAKSKED